MKKIIALVLIAGCGAKKAAPVKVPPIETPIPEYVEFTKVKPLLDDKCAKCHAGATPRAGIDLTSEESASQFKLEIFNEVDADKMPPRKPLSKEEKALLFSWTNQ